MRSIALLITACSAAAQPPPLIGNAGPVTAPLFGERELVAAGYTAEAKSNGTLLCRGQRCICVEPLDCGDCATRAHDVDEVRTHQENPDDCDAEVGHLCGVTYLVAGFLYDGDTRYYAGDRLVGELHSTDYPAYCDGGAMETLRGRVPDCAEPPRDARSLCTPARRLPQRMNPKDVLMLP